MLHLKKVYPDYFDMEFQSRRCERPSRTCGEVKVVLPSVEGQTITLRLRTEMKAFYLFFFCFFLAVHALILCPVWIPNCFFFVN